MSHTHSLTYRDTNANQNNIKQRSNYTFRLKRGWNESFFLLLQFSCGACVLFSFIARESIAQFLCQFAIFFWVDQYKRIHLILMGIVLFHCDWWSMIATQSPNWPMLLMMMMLMVMMKTIEWKFDLFFSMKRKKKRKAKQRKKRLLDEHRLWLKLRREKKSTKIDWLSFWILYAYEWVHDACLRNSWNFFHFSEAKSQNCFFLFHSFYCFRTLANKNNQRPFIKSYKMIQITTWMWQKKKKKRQRSCLLRASVCLLIKLLSHVPKHEMSPTSCNFCARPPIS